MNDSGRLISKSAGDAAVDGLLSGLVAGAVMAMYLVTSVWLAGDSPLALLARFDLSPNPNALTGALVHVGVSGVYGVIFGMITLKFWNRARARGWFWIAGIIFGLILFWLSQNVLLPNSKSALATLPFWQFGLAHLVYGTVLGFWMGRESR
ncbi:MAG: hypothetical protein HY070_09630 [Chloroflexi bacterium]|nr:hypothetical protein [Chloroflexota bacterium]